MDCSMVKPPMCYKSVCNDGSFPGTVGSCVVVVDDGADCEDGKFCTTNDKCMAGMCVGGPQNTCGMTPPQCSTVACVEATKSCTGAPDNAQDGTSCTTTDLCVTGAVCMAGQCTGTPKDCSFDPAGECNAVACDPQTGNCKATVDMTKNGAACSLTGDLCKNGKTCSNGTCIGGTAKDCSGLTHDCVVGQCVASNGICTAMPIPAGGMCAAATDQCNLGVCDAAGMCNAMPLTNGTACNDHNACTGGDVCNAGACGGSAVAGCQIYLTESFETCPPAGWTLNGDWKCGVSTNGPPSAEDGTKMIGTGLTTNYMNNDAYATTTAISPPINLAGATSPQLSFWMWVDSEGNSFDGANLNVSQNGGSTYSLLATSKPYNLTIATQSAWGGEESPATGQNLGWQHVTADLTAYAGKTVQLKFAFRSDGSDQFPGFFIDNMVIAEANAVPLSITTQSIGSPYVGNAFLANLQRTGGSSGAVWSIKGGTNSSWLSINPATGALSGTPTAANLGAGSVQIEVKEPTLPSNFDDKTYNFTVGTAIYYQNFEGACPDGWTLTGAWQCGTPIPITPAGNGNAPPTAFSGSHCLATGLGTGYASTNLTWAGNTATTPAINLTTAVSPAVDFQAWVETDKFATAFNLQASIDGGATFQPVVGVTPAYDTVDGPYGTPAEDGWSVYPNPGWQPYHADLSAFAGHSVILRLQFQSDFGTQYAGVYLDDFVVH